MSSHERASISPHRFGLNFQGLYKLRQPRRVYILDLHVPENRRNMVFVCAFVVVERSLFQLHGGIVFKVPFRKLREAHIFVELRVALVAFTYLLLCDIIRIEFILLIVLVILIAAFITLMITFKKITTNKNNLNSFLQIADDGFKGLFSAYFSFR